jgi:hypothetical protein
MRLILLPGVKYWRRKKWSNKSVEVMKLEKLVEDSK